MNSSPNESDLREMFELQTRDLALDERPHDAAMSVRSATHLGNSRSRRPVAVAAGLLLVVSSGATWWAVSTRGNAPASDRQVQVVVPVDPPLLVIEQAGWQFTEFNDFDSTVSGDRVTTFIDPTKGVTGPRVSVVVSDGGGATTLATDVSEITVGSSGARLQVDGDKTLVHWTQGELTLEAFGWKVSSDDIVAIASAMTAGSDGFAVATGQLPARLVEMTGRDAELMRRGVEYVWTSPDGTELRVDLSPPAAHDCCASLGNDTRVDFQGHQADASFDATTFQLTQQRGFWQWTILGYASPENADAASFADLDEFLAAADLIHETDEQTFRRSLPADVVLRQDRAAVLAELAQLPLPPGAAPVTVPDDGFTVLRRDLASNIAFDTACAWSSEFVARIDQSDVASAAVAAREIVNVASWAEIEDVLDEFEGTDGALTDVGRIRGAAELLEPFLGADGLIVGTLDQLPADRLVSILDCG